MATYSLANERLRALEDIEREIGAILQNAGTVILELSKEKTNERLLDRQAAAFTASVQHVEAELSGQIRYLTQVNFTSKEKRNEKILTSTSFNIHAEMLWDEV
ncbi:mediator of RNA polymerase II transcription subunit 11 isoform X2 [Manis javanica]|uniref:mediator of RNA polymerase II transcription subunit 11 isoform X2 n=1 Tax=Manis javanica TaxID=9974 RepID=UPI000812C44B|nr:mediator of RNA polymerase II transcription subunit 11 isoform X2 [Manis javanica]